MGRDLLDDKLVTSIAAIQWTVRSNSRVKAEFESFIGHELTEKELALMGSIFSQGALFWNNYLKMINNNG